jgi:hypothetical protein
MSSGTLLGDIRPLVSLVVGDMLVMLLSRYWRKTLWLAQRECVPIATACNAYATTWCMIEGPLPRIEDPPHGTRRAVRKQTAIREAGFVVVSASSEIRFSSMPNERVQKHVVNARARERLSQGAALVVNFAR